LRPLAQTFANFREAQSSEKAFRSEWVTRAFDETASDCLSDFSAGEMTRSTLLSARKEKEVIAAWRQQGRS